ncbi:MAG: hypothetical protein R2744_01675 [Bacteroidales bacterium]
MIHPHRKFNYLNLLHFIPFAFFAVSVIFRSDHVFTDIPGFFMSDRFISLRIVYGASFFSSITTYSVLAFILISNHQKNLQEYSVIYISVITLNWLKIISISFYIFHLIFPPGRVEPVYQFYPVRPILYNFVFVALLSFIYGLLRHQAACIVRRKLSGR